MRRGAGKRGKVRFIGKTGRGVVGVLGEFRPDQPPLGHGRKAGQARAGQKVVDQRSDEDGFARAGKPGNADAQGRGDGAGRGVGEVGEVMPNSSVMVVSRLATGAALRFRSK